MPNLKAWQRRKRMQKRDLGAKKMAGCVGSKKLRKENPRNVLKRKWSTISNTAERLNEMNTRKRSLVLASGK